MDSMGKLLMFVAATMMMRIMMRTLMRIMMGMGKGAA